MAGRDINTRDLRLHRQYILVVCFILIFLKFGGVSLEEVSLLGASFKISNTKAIYVGLWAILLYSLIRYYQYFRHESLESFLNEYQHLIIRYFQPKFQKLVENHIAPDTLAKTDPLSQRQLALPEYSNAHKVSMFRRRFKHKTTIVQQDKRYSESSLTNTMNTSSQKEIDFEFSTLRFSWLWIKVIFHFVFNTPFVFEFIFPFVLIVTTIVYCSIGNWEGSPFNLWK